MASVYISPSLQEWNVGYGMYGTEEQRMKIRWRISSNMNWSAME